jgi:hypothetical protein
MALWLWSSDVDFPFTSDLEWTQSITTPCDCPLVWSPPRNRSRHCQQHELLGLRGDQHSLVGSSLAGFSPCRMHASSPHCHHATVRHSSPAYRLQILAPDEVVKLFVSGCVPERPQSVLEDSPLPRNSSNRSAFSEPMATATTSPVQN